MGRPPGHACLDARRGSHGACDLGDHAEEVRAVEPARARVRPRYNVVVFAVGLGGALTDGLLAFSYTVTALFTEPLAMNVLEGVLRALIPALLGAVAGFGLGLVEGAVLALPLAAILGRIGSGDHRSMDGANQS